MSVDEGWVDVCAIDDLVVDRGACVLVDGRQVAVFRVWPDDQLYGLSNFDPFCSANVLSRGIVGSRGDTLKVASPMYKQSFDLRTGVCLDDPTVSVEVFQVRCRNGRVEVRSAPVSDACERTIGAANSIGSSSVREAFL